MEPHNSQRVWILLALVVGASCSPLSEQVRDPAIGMNGGFEHTQAGQPVNWMVYPASATSARSYDLRVDGEDFKQGRQSLQFTIQECSDLGGRHSPGVTQEFPATPGTTYSIRFWIKSEGCAWTASFGGVGAKTGEYERQDSSGLPAGVWHEIEQAYTPSADAERLRFELSITSPGKLWFDDVRIEPALRPPRD